MLFWLEIILNKKSVCQPESVENPLINSVFITGMIGLSFLEKVVRGSTSLRYSITHFVQSKETFSITSSISENVI